SNKLGLFLVGDPGVVLGRDPDRVRAPDACFIAAERALEARRPTGFLQSIPDFVVEVVSPGDTAAEIQEKVEEWLRAGVRLVWAMYPNTRSVFAFRGLDSARVYVESDTIDGAPVLPDFTCRVADLFA